MRLQILKDQRAQNLLAILVQLLLILVILSPLIFSDMTIQGIDGNHGARSLVKAYMEQGKAGWWNPNWLGSSAIFTVKTQLFFRYLLPLEQAVIATLATVLSLASIFMFLLLRRFGLKTYAASFGAISFAFAPHFFTLVYPMHGGPLNMVAYIPMLFYFMTIAFDRDFDAVKSWAASLMAAFAWGMVMNEDPQRGIYVSVLALAYLISLLWIHVFENSPSRAKSKSFAITIAASRTVVIGLVTFLIFYSNLIGYLGNRNISGGPSSVQSDSSAAGEQSWEFATSWSLNPEELADSLAPGYHGSLSGDADKPYWGARPVAHSSDSLGLFIVLFGIFGAAVGFRREQRVRFFAIAAILATLLAFGRFWPGRPFFWLWYQLPMMDKFRAPVKFMAVTAFAISILSAYGLHYLMDALSDNAKIVKYLRRSLLVLFGIGIVWVLGLIGNEPFLRTEILTQRLGGDSELAKRAFKNALTAVLTMNIFLLLGAIVLRLSDRYRDFPHRIQISAYVFILMMVVDLLLINRFYLTRSLVDPDQFYSEDDVIAILKSSQDPARVTTTLKLDHGGRMVPLPLSSVGNHYITYLFPYFKIESFDSPPQSRVAQDYRTFFAGMLAGFPRTQDPEIFAQELIDSNIRLWRLCNVRYLISDGNLYGLFRRPIPIMEALSNHPGLNFVGTAKGFAGREQAVFEIRDALPRFAFYGDFATVDNADKSFEMLSYPGFDVDSLVVVEDVPESLAPAGKTHYAQPEILEEKNGYAKLGIDAAHAGILLMNSRYDESWKAYIDGRPTDTLRANFIMTAVPLPAGEHIVEFRFEPETGSLRISMTTIIVTFSAAILLLIVNLMFEFRRNRRSRNVSSN